MNLRKIIPTVIGAAAVCVLLPLAPHIGQAAEVTNIETPKAGDIQLKVTFTDGQPTDKYQILVNDKTVNFGFLGDDVTDPDTMHFNLSYIPEGQTGTPVKDGDKIEFRLQKGSEMISHEMTVGEEATPNLPTSMTLKSKTVARGDNAFATLIFDKDYVPAENDSIFVQPYDKDGEKLDPYFADIPDTYDDPVQIQLKDIDEADYYELTFIPGGGGASNLSVRIDVTEGGDTPTEPSDPDEDQQEMIDNAESMIFSYPSSIVALGESVTPTIQLKDKDGTTHTYTGPVTFSYSGDAIVEGTFDSSGRFTVGSDQIYVGTTIQVTAMVGGKFSQTVQLTVQAGDKSLILTPDSGSSGNARAVTFQLADGKGNRLRLVWGPTAAKVVIKPTDPTSNAKMSGTVTNLSSLTTNGSGTMLISSDAVGEAELYIIFQDNAGRFYQTALGTFDFTEPTGEGDMNLQLTIGSAGYTVNGISYTADTAPVVNNGRTFVPFRLLGEALGGAVTFDNTTRTITTVYGEHTITMTIGSKSYTIDGTTKEMDVEPYINSDNRTMVPLRVLSEAFGCKVTPQYGTSGTTTGVLVER